jgi:hypothetical protein
MLAGVVTLYVQRLLYLARKRRRHHERDSGATEA